MVYRHQQGAFNMAAPRSTKARPAPAGKAAGAGRSAVFIPRQPPFKRYRSVVDSVVVGVAATVIAVLFVRGLSVEIGANAFFLAYLVSILMRLPRLTKAHLRAHADESDIPGLFILALALVSVAVASGSLLMVLNSGNKPDPLQLGLGILSVVLGWLALHTMLGFHYAYEYYGSDEASPADADGHRPHVGGLAFPGSDQPDGLSFLYFSFVVAMTAQVSDVTVTSNSMRRLVLLHGILSFFFNTVILATAVNIIVALGHP
jgi:uncharacterized membrane protein